MAEILSLFKLYNNLGKVAVSVKINAKGNAKLSMPIIGLKNSPLADATRILPTIGAVQEKLIKTKVKAIKKTPRIPSWSAFLFILFKKELGRAISKAPKNDNAKIKNIIKNITFAIALVAKALRAVAPKSKEVPTPKIIKIEIIEKP